MSKRSTIAIGIAVLTLIASIITYFALTHGDIHVKISQDSINQQLQNHFPKKKSYLKIFHVTYQNPRVILLPQNNKLELSLDTSVEIGLKSLHTKAYSGTTALTTSVSYQKNTHQFFLTNPEISSISIPNLSDEELAILRDGLNLAAELWFEEIPIYQLKNRRNSEKFASLILKEIHVNPSNITATIGLPEDAP